MAERSKILFAGDPHGDFQPLISAVKKYRPEAVVLLGDYDLKKPLQDYIQDIIGQTEIWWIAGNHDFDPPEHHHNLFSSHLADQSLHLKVVDIAGIRIAGLGGIFLGRVWYPPHSPKWKSKQHYLNSFSSNTKPPALSLKYQSAIWHNEWAELKKLKADILVTHEGARCHRHGFIAIDQLAEAMGVSKVFHGHLHEHYSATIGNGIQVFGVRNANVVDLLGDEV